MIENQSIKVNLQIVLLTSTTCTCRNIAKSKKPIGAIHFFSNFS